MAITKSSIAVTEGSGKNLDTVVVNTDKHREGVFIGHPDAASQDNILKPTSAGAMPIDDGGGTITVDGPLTDSQLRASAIDVNIASGGDAGLTDAELRATPVPVDASGSTVPVSGTFWQATQPVSAASLPLPSGASTASNQTTANSSLSSIDGKLPALVSSRVPVDGSGVTQPVSAASLPLPSGAATSAKQPALGTAGSPSTDVLSIQGVASGTAVKVDGSAVTQPVSAASLPLPSGASTAANQSTGNSSLSSIDGKLPALVSSRVPVDASGVAVPVTDNSGSLTTDVGPSPSLEVSFSTTSAQAVGSTDVTGYRSVSVHIVQQGGSSTVSFQASNDNTNWVSVGLQGANGTPSGTPSTGTTGTGIFFGNIPGRYFRLNVTGIVSGTTSGVIEFSPIPIAPSSVSAGSNLTALLNNAVNVNTGNAASGTQRMVLATDQPAVAVKASPQTSGGCSTASGSIQATATSIKSSAGQLYLLDIFNSNTSPVYAQLFDLATGSTTLGTSTPKLSIGIPAGGGKVIALDSGIGAFATAITIAFTTTRAGSGAPTNSVDYNASYV